MKAAVHLGQDDPQNLRTTNNTYFDQIKHFFNISRKLILNQEQEIHGISTIDWDTIHGQAAPCRTTKLSSRHRQKCTSSQIRYFVPGGRIAEYPRSVASWKDKIDWSAQSPEYREMDNVDGEPAAFEWKQFPGHTILKLLQEVQCTMEEKNSVRRIQRSDHLLVSVQRHRLGPEAKKDSCPEKFSSVAACAARFPTAHWSFLGPGSEEKWFGTLTHTPNGGTMLLN